MAQVYALRNTVNGKAYIGCTRSGTAKRFREHRCLLRAGRHTCAPLQQDWRSFGEGSFQMVVERECSDDLPSRRDAELHIMERYADRLYNEEMNSFKPTEAAIRHGVEAARHSVGNRWSDEANRKRSVAQKGKPKGHGAKISATKRARAVQQVMR